MNNIGIERPVYQSIGVDFLSFKSGAFLGRIHDVSGKSFVNAGNRDIWGKILAFDERAQGEFIGGRSNSSDLFDPSRVKIVLIQGCL